MAVTVGGSSSCGQLVVIVARVVVGVVVSNGDGGVLGVLKHRSGNDGKQ